MERSQGMGKNTWIGYPYWSSWIELGEKAFDERVKQMLVSACQKSNHSIVEMLKCAQLIRRIFMVSRKLFNFIPGFNRFFTTFSLIFGVGKKVTNKLIIFKLGCNDFLVRRIFFPFFFLIPSIYYITICF